MLYWEERKRSGSGDSAILSVYLIMEDESLGRGLAAVLYVQATNLGSATRIKLYFIRQV
jgi:hypothetical protein